MQKNLADARLVILATPGSIIFPEIPYFCLAFCNEDVSILVACFFYCISHVCQKTLRVLWLALHGQRKNRGLDHPLSHNRCMLHYSNSSSACNAIAYIEKCSKSCFKITMQTSVHIYTTALCAHTF